MNEKDLKLSQSFEPRIVMKTQNMGGFVAVWIKDKCFTISPIGDKIFDSFLIAFFTSQPTGEGTGLGLSMTYDMIAGQQSREFKAETETEIYRKFINSLHYFNF